MLLSVPGLFERHDETRELCPIMVEQLTNVNYFRWGSVVQAESELEVRIDLSQGSTRGGKLIQVFSPCQPAVPLGDVGCDGDCCSSELCCQSVSLLPREASGELVALYAQVDRSLPHPKIAMIANDSHNSPPRMGRAYRSARAVEASIESLHCGPLYGLGA